MKHKLIARFDKPVCEKDLYAVIDPKWVISKKPTQYKFWFDTTEERDEAVESLKTIGAQCECIIVMPELNDELMSSMAKGEDETIGSEEESDAPIT